MDRYRNVLFVGTGGGNDIFSTTLAMLALRERGMDWERCSVAGVLSPFHRYRGLRRTDNPDVVAVTDSDIRRIVPRLKDAFEIGMVEPHVAAMAARERDLKIDAVYGLLLRHGTRGLAEAFQWLGNAHDLVVLVDIGGDILFRGHTKDPRVLSPMFDAMVLEAFCESGVPGILFEAGPGTDGELDRRSLAETLSRPVVRPYPLSAASVDEWERLYRAYVEPVRPGRTVPKTIEAFRSDQATLSLDYRARCHIGTRRWYATFPHDIDVALNRSYYLVSPQWARRRNPLCVPCEHPMRWVQVTQPYSRHIHGEFRFEYVELDGPDDWWLLALPSPLFPVEQRSEMVEAAFQDLRAGNCRGLVLESPSGLTYRTS